MIILGVSTVGFGVLAFYYYYKYEMLLESIERQTYVRTTDASEEETKGIARSTFQKREYEAFTITSTGNPEDESMVEYKEPTKKQPKRDIEFEVESNL